MTNPKASITANALAIIASILVCANWGETAAASMPNSQPTARDYFSGANPWTRDVSQSPVDGDSERIIGWLSANGGWGTGRMQVDFSLAVLEADSTSPRVPVVHHPSGKYYLPDCDEGVNNFPVPEGGAIEGESGYTCTSKGDCHILVLDRENRKLFESYRSNLDSGSLQSGCAVVWDLDRIYGDTLRGDQCTSTDAAGFPIAPLLFTADEIFAGEISHAIRFILPNKRMRAHVYVRPATHAGGPSGPVDAVPYGARFRLKSSPEVEQEIAALKPAARVVARAMQKYGMLLADGGDIALTAASDRFTKHKWSEVGFGPRDLATLRVSDFEMIEAGARIPLTYDCVRNP